MGLYDRGNFAGQLSREQLLLNANRVAAAGNQDAAVRAAAQGAAGRLGLLERMGQSAPVPAPARPNMVGWSGRVYDELDRNKENLTQDQLMSRTGASRQELQTALLYLRGTQKVAHDVKRGRYSIASPPAPSDGSTW